MKQYEVENCQDFIDGVQALITHGGDVELRVSSYDKDDDVDHDVAVDKVTSILDDDEVGHWYDIHIHGRKYKENDNRPGMKASEVLKEVKRCVDMFQKGKQSDGKSCRPLDGEAEDVNIVALGTEYYVTDTAEISAVRLVEKTSDRPAYILVVPS